jgi:branched-chain amino acid transport system permease protein
MLDNIQLLFVWAPIINIQIILEGIFLGAVFALSAYGLALVWGVMNIKNLAQGDFVIMGGYLSLALSQYDLNIFVILPLVMIIMFFYGLIIYKVMIKRVIDQDMFTSLLATFGLSLLMQQVMNLIWGPEVQIIDLDLPIYDAFDGFVTIPSIKIISLVLAGVLSLAIVLFMKKSRLGQAIRATAQDPRAARVLGIDTDRIYAFTFSLNSAICGAAGVFVSVIWVLQPFYGITYSVRSFAIVTAAGLGNLPAVITAGFGIGLFEKYVGAIVGTAYEVAAPVSMLLIVLVFRQINMRKQRQAVK